MNDEDFLKDDAMREAKAEFARKLAGVELAELLERRAELLTELQMIDERIAERNS